MAESQKEGSSAGQPKKKNSLLDLDFEKDDFLSSWKSMSVTGDDAMDLDFGPISKGKKKAFNFDKSFRGIDFDLDGDFGKLPSFNLDIPDIDISSPAKKDGKSKEASSKESASGKSRGKADHFDFSFDFNDLDGFNFESTSKKEDKMVKGGEDKEDSSNKMLSQRSRDCPAENADIHQSESRNYPVSDCLVTSKFDLQGYSPESSTANSPSNSAKDDVSLKNPLARIDEEASVRAATSVMETASNSNLEVNCQLDQLMPPNSHSPDICIANENQPDNSKHSALRNESTQDTVPEAQEEVSFRDTEAYKLEKSADNKLIGDDCEIPAWSGSAVLDIAGAGKEQAGGQDPTDNTALVAIKERAEPVQSGTQVENLLPANASRESVPKSKVNVKNQGGVSSTLNSRTTADALMLEKEREAVTRSKYFKQPDKTESQFRSTSNQPTHASINDREVGTKQLCPPDGSKKHIRIVAESNSRLAGISSLHSVIVTGKEHSQRLESAREFKTNRPHDEDVMKEKHAASTRGDKNVKSLHSFRPHVNNSSLHGLAIKSSSKDIANSASQAMNVEANQNRKTSAGAEDQLSSVKSLKQMPTLSTLTTSRASRTNLDSSKFPAQKYSMLSRDVQQCRNLAESTLSKAVEVAVTKKQTPIAPSLKRKINEACNTNMILKPLKRLSGSPRSSESMETSGKIVNSKACEIRNVADGQKNKNVGEKKNNSTPRASDQVVMNELEGPFSLDYDGNIEMAKACSKGLEDICNLLSKKHEEAKDLLARAVVNNNKLLMLNHPIYEEKIRMVQKFATQLTSREIRA